MKFCKNCYREFNEREDDALNPIDELGKIFLEATGDTNVTDYCPECREELGLVNLVGFEK